ncbi:MAG: Ig-like domain-containing protein [Reinekea sp.]
MTAKVLFALPLIASALSARAELPVWLSIDAGMAGPLQQDDYSQQIDDAGLNASLSGTDSWRFGWRFGLGLDLNDWLPVADPWLIASQLEYYSLGPVEVDFSGSFTDATTFYDALDGIHPESAEQGVAWSLLGRWQGFSGALARVGLGARLGVTGWNQAYELKDSSGNKVGSDDLSGVSATAGLETTYDIVPQLKARLGWQAYWLDSESVQLVSLGLEFRPWPNAPGPKVWPLTPEQMADQYTLNQGQSRTLAVLANDVSGDYPLSISSVSTAAGGDVSIAADQQSLNYQHQGGTAAQDQFKYWFATGKREYGPVTVTVNVVLPEPVATADQFSVAQNQSRTLAVLTNDRDPNNLPLTISRVQTATDSLSMATTDGQVIQYQHRGKAAQDQLSYWLSNGRSEVGPVTVTIQVDIPAPKGIADLFLVAQGTQRVLDVLFNDVNYGDTDLSISRVTQADHGDLHLNNGMLSYQHDGSLNAFDHFLYWLSDGEREVGPIRVQLDIIDRSFSESQTLYIHFETNGAVISEEYLPELEEFARQFNDIEDMNFVIYGYTDSSGSDEVNLEVSQRRADAIKSYLVNEFGMDAGRLQTVANGESDPIASNDTVEGRAKNRRVEIRLEK